MEKAILFPRSFYALLDLSKFLLIKCQNFFCDQFRAFFFFASQVKNETKASQCKHSFTFFSAQVAFMKVKFKLSTKYEGKKISTEQQTVLLCVLFEKAIR